MDLGLFHYTVLLLNHVFLGAIGLLLYISAESQTDKLPEWFRQLLLGVIFGGTVVWSLLDPVVVAPGVFMSAAAPSVALAGLFGGFLGGPIAAAFGIGVRIAQGGISTVAPVVNVLGALIAGLAVRELALRTSGRIRFVHVALMSVLIVLASVASLTILPPEKFRAVFPSMWPVIATIHPLAAMVLGGLLILESRRREASQAFSERDRQFRAVVENLPGTVYQMRMNEDGTLTYLFMSKVVEHTAGVSPDEAVANAKAVDSRFFPEEEEERRTYLQRSMKTMQPGFRDFRMRFVDGSIRWLRTYSTPHRDEKGRFVWDGVTLDITEEKRQRESLQESHVALAENERRFRTLVKNLPGAVFQLRQTVSGEFQFPFLSEGIRHIYGFTAAEGQADPSKIIGALLPEENEAMHRNLEHSAANMAVRDWEYRIGRTDGSIRWIRSLSVPTRADNGDFLWDGYLFDITDEKATSAALAESERRFRAIVENLPGLVFQARLDKTGQMHFTYLSDRIRALGITPEQAIADPSLIYRTYLPEEEDDHQRAVAESATHLTPLNRSYRVRMPDGSVVWRHTYATPLRNSLGDVVWDGVTVDINSSKMLEQELRYSNARLEESERRFRTIADNLPGVVFQARRALDGKLTYLYLSDGAKQVYGIPALEIMADAQALKRVLFEEDEAERKLAVRDSMANPTLRVRDFRVRQPDGTVRWMRSRAVPTRLPDGSTLWEGLTIDITDQKRMEDELRGAERLQALGQLTSGVAHQFNNILMIISGNVELLAKEAGDATLEPDPVSQIQNAISRGSDITLELQSFSRMQSLNREIRDIQEILIALQALTRTVLGPEVSLDLRMESPLPPVFIDGERLQNALLQLLLNGRDAMPSGGHLAIAAQSVRVTDEVSADKGLRPGTYVAISVQDEGIGMTAETLAHAMDPFFTTKSVGEGKGLGLSTVHGFASQSGGRFELTSAEGEGTTATLFIPAASLDRLAADMHADLGLS